MCRWLFDSGLRSSWLSIRCVSGLKDYERAQRARLHALELIFRVNRGGGVGLTNLPQILRNKKK